MNLIIVGPQGSGKGTQAKMISQHYEILRISTGDILREMAKEDNETGKKIKQLLNSGAFVSDEFIFGIVKDRLCKPDCKDGWILDGFPRNLAQAKMLDAEARIDKVIYLDISDSEAIHRLSTRWQCKGCGAIYGEAKPPKKAGFCDSCNTPLYQREDEKSEIIRIRLNTFHKETAPLLEFYETKGILSRINGERPIEEIFGDIKKVIDL